MRKWMALVIAPIRPVPAFSQFHAARFLDLFEQFRRDRTKFECLSHKPWKWGSA